MNSRTLEKPASRSAQKGASLVFGLLMTTVLTIVGVTAAKSSATQQRLANNYRFSIEAMNNAEVGVATVINQLNDNDLTLDGFDNELDRNGDGVFDDRFGLVRSDVNSNVFFNVVLIDDDDGDGDPSVDSNGIVRLMSQGTSSVGSTRTIDVRIAAAVGVGPPGASLDSAILTDETLIMAGNAEFHGANQDIHSNGDVQQADHPITSGTISAVGNVDGSPQGGGSAQSGAPYVDIPTIDPSMFAEFADYIFRSNGRVYNQAGTEVGNADGNAWNGWKFGGDKWTIENDDPLGGFLYFEGNYANVILSTAPGSDSDPWEISILADGWIEISGNPTLTNYMDPDDPPSVQAIQFMSGADIKINGNSSMNFSGLIAAAEQIEISGNPDMEGVLLAGGQSNDSDYVKENYISGEMNMTYNGGLMFPSAFETPGDATAVVLSWQDLEIARDTDVFAPVHQGQEGY